MLDPQLKRAFAEDGYVMVRQAVPPLFIEAARREIQKTVQERPPAAGYQGPYFYFLQDNLPDSLLALLSCTGAIEAAEALITPAKFETPDHIQISLNLPPWNHGPGGPHIDGLSPLEPSGRPGTFTLLAGIFLTDQTGENEGNLWVWPGSHLLTADYLRQHGPDKLLSSVPYPPVALPEPHPVTGRVGDMLLAHYLLGHNMGGNISARIRETVYFRLRCENHRERWRDAVQNPFFEFPAVNF